MSLARKLVEHPRWKWVAGMQAGEVRLVGFQAGLGLWLVTDAERSPNPWELRSAHAETLEPPDLTDYATAAILLRMAMEALEASGQSVEWALDTSGSCREEMEISVPLDVGTKAAKTLLAAWGEEGAGRR